MHIVSPLRSHKIRIKPTLNYHSTNSSTTANLQTKMSNIETIKQIYQSFERHDIPAILSKLADDVEWEYGNGPTNVPWLQEIKKREAVIGFFESLGAVDITLFQPKMFFEDQNVVVALLDVQWTCKETGKFVDNQDEVHIWHFNAKGEIVKYGHRVDTHSHWLALQTN